MVSIDNNYISNLSTFNVLYDNTGNFDISFTLERKVDYGVYIYDIVGKIVYHEVLAGEVGENEMELNIPNMTIGVYFVSFQNNQELYSEKVIIR